MTSESDAWYPFAPLQELDFFFFFTRLSSAAVASLDSSNSFFTAPVVWSPLPCSLKSLRPGGGYESNPRTNPHLERGWIKRTDPPPLKPTRRALPDFGPTHVAGLIHPNTRNKALFASVVVTWCTDYKALCSAAAHCSMNSTPTVCL